MLTDFLLTAWLYSEGGWSRLEQERRRWSTEHPGCRLMEMGLRDVDDHD
jgi:hypothetical protein